MASFSHISAFLSLYAISSSMAFGSITVAIPEKTRDFVANTQDNLRGIADMPDSIDKNHVIILVRTPNHADRMQLFAAYTSIAVARSTGPDLKGTLAVDEWFIPIVPRDFTVAELKDVAKKLDERVKATEIPKHLFWPTKSRQIRAVELVRAHFLLERKQRLLNSLIINAELAQKPDAPTTPILLGATSDSKTHAVIGWGIQVNDLMDTLIELLPETKDPAREISSKEVHSQAPLQVIIQVTPPAAGSANPSK